MAENSKIYYGGGIALAGSIDVQAIGVAADSRLMVQDRTGLTELQNAKRVYDGMIVYCESDQTFHKSRVVWDDNKNIVSCTWTEVVIKSEDELRTLITNSTTAAMEFKGATASLPTSGVKGDMYKITSSFTVAAENDAEGEGFITAIGDSIVYDGEKWYHIPTGDDIEDTWRPVFVGDATLGGIGDGKGLKFAAGNLLDVTLTDAGEIEYAHEAVAAPTNTNADGDEKVREYITSVTTDGYGHITGFKTNIETVADTSYTFTGTSDDATSDVYFNIQTKVDGEDVEGATETIYLDAYTQSQTDTKITEAIEALDVTDITGFGAGKTLATLTETDGKIAATFQDIAITKDQVSGFGTMADESADDYYTKTDLAQVPTALNLSQAEYYNNDVVLEWRELGRGDESRIVFAGTNGIEISATSSSMTIDASALSDRILDIEEAGYATTGEVETAKQEAITEAANQSAVVLAEAQEFATAAVEAYADEHASDYTNEQIDQAIEDATGALGTMSTKSADDYYTKTEAGIALAGLEVSEGESYIAYVDFANLANDGKETLTIEGANGIDITVSSDDKKITIDGHNLAEEIQNLQNAGYATTNQVATAKQEAIDAAAKDAADKAAVVLAEAQKYADGLDHEDTTYTVTATANPLEFTVSPDGKSSAQTVTLVAPTVDVGVTKVNAGTDIVVTPEAGTGEVTVAHATYATGAIEIKDSEGNAPEDPCFISGLTLTNGHITGALAQSLKDALESMTFILDGGNAGN